MSSAHIVDSRIFGRMWATEEMRALFTDEGRTQSWLEILAALARSQAELGIVPAAAAEHIAERASVELIDLDRFAAGNEQTSHSTLGLIWAVQEKLEPFAREWFYLGATVQDVTDTWTGLIMRRVGELVARDVLRIERALVEAAAQHRDTVMLGRTHGQPGLPITYGFKAAVWAAELRRHRERLEQARPRLAVGQLCGAAGTVSSSGEEGLELQRRFCARLGLSAPDMTWLTARDRVAEFTVLLAMITGTIAKIGNEVYNLQRPEIAELSEGEAADPVGSITMPHKRNPELSEQLGSVGRIVRAAAALALEGMVHEHERDGAAWKTEWSFLPEACLATSASLSIGAGLAEGLEPDPERMRRNVDDQRGYVMSEAVMAALAERLGKGAAHEVVYEVAMAGQRDGRSFRDALLAEPRITDELDEATIDALLEPQRSLGRAGELVDRVVARGLDGGV